MPQATETGEWLRRFHPTQRSDTRLICFPHAGGSATFYFPVSAALIEAADVIAVQYPGRQDRRAEPPVVSIPELADALLREIRPLTNRPLSFFGHSMGAVLAYEVALRLEREGTILRQLFVSGRRAPSRHRSESVHRLGDEDLLDEVRRLGWVNNAVLGDAELREMILPALRNDYRAVENYRHTEGAAVNCPLNVLVGTEDPLVTADEAQDWRRHSSGPVTVHSFTGGHFYLNEHSSAVIALIAEKIAPSSAR